ncbi:hypothetical protein [Carboxylicivirga marina]|uniref:hypothetical protein n=1 Tax=Carboxylicivirga marina TaxID=2800988 RepID=UPI0025949B04|nr:hypothetical protein [uncultured Carboxylicivirga sp.]
MDKKKRATNAAPQKTPKVSQNLIVLKCVEFTPKTRRQIEHETQIHTNTLDWIVNNLLKRDVLFVAYKSQCPQTGSDGVQFVTSNEEYRTKPPFIQGDLFND